MAVSNLVFAMEGEKEESVKPVCAMDCPELSERSSFNSGSSGSTIPQDRCGYVGGQHLGFDSKEAGSNKPNDTEHHAVPTEKRVSMEHFSRASVDSATKETLGTDLSVFDPIVRDTVRGTIKTIVKALVALVVVFPMMLALFYGVGWNPKQNYGNIKVAILDLDGGIIGQTLLAVTSNPSITFTMLALPNSTTLETLMNDVNRGDYNGALVVNAGASQKLLACLTDPSASYNPADATSIIFDEGRGGTAMASLLRLGVLPLATSATNQAVAKALFKRAAGSGRSLGGINPKALITPVGNTEINLHPVHFSGEMVAMGLSFIMNWVLAMIAVSALLAMYHPWRDAGIRADHHAAAHVAATAFVTCFIAFWPVAVLKMLGSPIGPATAFSLWSYNWYSMLTFGAVVLALFRGLGPAKGGGAHSLFLLLNFIASPAVAPAELMYAPLRVGVALPLQSAVEGARTILFGSYDVLGRCFGVITGWLVICLAFLAYSARAEYLRERAAAEATAKAKAAAEAAAAVVEVVVVESHDGDGEARRPPAAAVEVPE